MRGENFADPLLSDVAAGRGSFAFPLRMELGREQPQAEAGSDFRLLSEDDAVRVWRRPAGGDWLPEYRFTLTPRRLSDFEEGNQYHQTSPESGFTRGRLATLMTPSGRITLSDRRLIATVHGQRTERDLDDEDAVQQTLAKVFGIDLTSEYRTEKVQS